MKKVKDLVKDSIFCAILCTVIMLFNFISLADYLYISLIILIFLGCYFQNKEIKRVVISTAIIFLVSNLIINPLYVLIFVLPSLLLGIIATIFLQRKITFKIAFLALSAVCFTINMIIELAFAKFIMNMNFFDYILLDDTFGMQELILEFSKLFIACYIVMVAIISVMEILLLYSVNKIYKRRIAPLIKEEIE